MGGESNVPKDLPNNLGGVRPGNEVFFFFLQDFIYLFLERGEGKEKEERNISVWLPHMRPPLGMQPATQACALIGN